jgi:hypothetical protein
MEMKFLRLVAGYTLKGHKTNQEVNVYNFKCNYCGLNMEVGILFNQDK